MASTSSSSSLSSSLSQAIPALNQLPLLSPKKKELLKAGVEILPACDANLVPHHFALLKEFFEAKNLNCVETIAEQCYLIKQHVDQHQSSGADWDISLGKIALFLGVGLNV